MSKSKISRASVHVSAYAPLAEHYKARVAALVQRTVDALAEGDIAKIHTLYEQGVFAQLQYDHFSRMAACVGQWPPPVLQITNTEAPDA